MGDYGLRISKDGIDVKTGADKDMVVTSKYAGLKGSISGTKTGNCASGAGGPWDPWVITTLTVAHKLGYIPMVQAFIQDGSYYRLLPVQTELAFSAWVGADDTNLYIYCGNNTGGTVSVSLKYFIFLDKGKL